MAYTKNTWKTGDIVSSQKLNHMEDGIANAGSILVIGGFSYDDSNNAFTGTSDKTWQEIDNALAAGVRCVVVYANMDGHTQITVNSAALVDGKYIIAVDKQIATTTSVDGYPAIGAAIGDNPLG